jgi:hypothetical protein
LFHSHSEAISKIIPPHESSLSKGYYVFVDLRTADEAARAVRELNGAKAWNGPVTVGLAKEKHSWKVEERDNYIKQRRNDEE